MSGVPVRRPATPRNSPRWSLSSLLLSASVLSAASALAAPAPTDLEAVKSPEDFAGIYLDRFVPPGENLDLSPGGLEISQAHANYYLGLIKEKAGDDDRAVNYYKAVLERDPSATELASRAAHIAAQNNDIATGLAILKESRRHNPDNPGTYLVLSDFYATFVDDDKTNRNSIRIATDAFEKFPDNPWVVQHLVLMHVGIGETGLAEKALEKALKSNSEIPFYWLRMGRVAQHVWPLTDPSTGPPDRINAIYEKALALSLAGNPEDTRMAEAVADYYAASGQSPRAIEIYRDITTKNPEAISPREKLSRLYLLNRDTDQVIEVLNELLELRPDRPKPHKFLAGIYEERSNVYRDRVDEDGKIRPLTNEEMEYLAKALDHYEIALRLAKGEYGDYLRTAELMLRHRRTQDAVDLLERARFHYPENGPVARFLAICYHFNENHKLAISTFEETIRLAAEPNAGFLDYNLYFRYGASCEREKEYEKAADLFRKAITLVPEEEPERGASIYNYLGYMWLEQDINIDEAGELIKKALELVPDDPSFIDSLGWFHFKKGNYTEAITLLLKAENELGEETLDAVVLDHIAQAYHQLGNQEKAIEYGKRAVELDPETEDYAKRLKEFRENSKPAPAAPTKKEDSAEPVPNLSGSPP